MKWRNAEGREFPVLYLRDEGLGSDVPDGCRLPSGRFATAGLMRDLGYELVEDSPDSSVTAEQVGSPSAVEPSARNDESVRFREAQRKAWEECAMTLRSWENDRESEELLACNPYATPTEAVSVGTEGADEFEVVCGVDLGIGLAGATVGGEASLRDPRLIPGELYLVRKVKR